MALARFLGSGCGTRCKGVGNRVLDFKLDPVSDTRYTPSERANGSYPTKPFVSPINTL